MTSAIEYFRNAIAGTYDVSGVSGPEREYLDEAVEARTVVFNALSNAPAALAPSGEKAAPEGGQG